jgi:uncharacterized protein YqeY
MAARDPAAVSALRSALAAIENAGAVDAPPTPPPGTTHPTIAGSVSGLGATEVQRRALTEAQVTEIVDAEIAERLSAALNYSHLGHPDRGDRLRAEAEVLSRYLPRSLPPA